MPDYSYDLPANYYFGGGGNTFLPPLAIAVLILAVILILTLPRKYAFVPFLLAGLLIPISVKVAVMTLDFNSTRILLLAGWTRLIFRGELYPKGLNSLDKVIVLSALVNAIAYCILWGEFGAIINRMGFLFSSLGTYFLLRSLIRDKEDVVLTIKVLAFVVILIAPLIWFEHLTHHNLFSLVGASEFSLIRNGRVRAQGPFAHAIIAGTFGVVLIPLFVGLLWARLRSRLVAVAGIVSSIVMMIASSSSTPIMSFLGGIFALMVWPMRRKMRLVRWGIAIMIIGVQLVMKSPIWFLIARVSGLVGGHGWHRAMLIDNFVRHFFDWYLIGTRNNADWGWSMWDVDNAYVGAGLMGGLAGFILFLAIFVCAYRIIGIARKITEESHEDARLIWAIGSTLFANTIAFLGIVYFDQSMIAWYTLLVIIQQYSSLPLDGKTSDLKWK
jgi:hypothetical protein